MWFPFVWLALGFVLKWTREFIDSTCRCAKRTYWEVEAKLIDWGPRMFDFLILILSFALVWLLFGLLAVTIWKAIIVFLFWGFVVVAIKAR